MDILRNLFGHVTAGIIRLLVTIGIIAAIGYFLVKPALETTEKIGRETNVSIREGFKSNGNLNNIDSTLQDVNRQVQREINRSFRQAKKAGGHDSDKLITCIQRAHQDVAKIQRCTRRF